MIAGVIGGGREKGRVARAKEESGLIVAAAAAGTLPKRWADQARQKRQREVCLPSHGPSVPTSGLPVVKFLRLPAFQSLPPGPEGVVSISPLPVALPPAPCFSFLISLCPYLPVSPPATPPGSLCLSPSLPARPLVQLSLSEARLGFKQPCGLLFLFWSFLQYSGAGDK